MHLTYICFAADNESKRLLPVYPSISPTFLSFLHHENNPHSCLYSAIKAPSQVGLFFTMQSENQNTPLSIIGKNINYIIHHDAAKAPLDIEKVEDLANCFSNIWQLPHPIKESSISFSIKMFLMDALHLFRIDFSYHKDPTCRLKSMHVQQVVKLEENIQTLVYIDKGPGTAKSVLSSSHECKGNIEDVAVTFWNKEEDPKNFLFLLNIAQIKNCMMIQNNKDL